MLNFFSQYFPPVEGLTITPVGSADEVRLRMNEGDRQRTIAATKMNNTSRWGVTKPGLFRDKYINTMAADDLAPSVVRSSATMPLNIQDKCALVLHDEGFQLPVFSDKNWNYIFMFINTDSTRQGFSKGSLYYGYSQYSFQEYIMLQLW